MPKVTLSDEAREELQSLAAKHSSAVKVFYNWETCQFRVTFASEGIPEDILSGLRDETTVEVDLIRVPRR